MAVVRGDLSIRPSEEVVCTAGGLHTGTLATCGADGPGCRDLNNKPLCIVSMNVWVYVVSSSCGAVIIHTTQDGAPAQKYPRALGIRALLGPSSPENWDLCRQLAQ